MAVDCSLKAFLGEQVESKLMKILQLVNYALDKPRHGGQIRCSEIRRELVSLGHEVVTVSVLNEGLATNQGPYVNVRATEVQIADNFNHLDWLPLVSDLVAHKWLISNQGQTALLAALGDVVFEAVVVEQPWGFEGLQKFFANQNPKPKFIYSSHNHEAPLKRSILESFLGVSNNPGLDEVEQAIKSIELNALSRADEIWTVGLADLAWLPEIDVTKIKTLPNGTRRILRAHSQLEKRDNFAIFIGSAYPPNFEGFRTLLGDDLYFLPPNFRILCVGGVANLIREWAENSTLATHLIGRLEFREDVTDLELTDLISRAKFFILPISTGSGSNLKTAEALASGKPLVATSKAMRGFEKWELDNDVHISNLRSEFRTAVGFLARESCKPPIERETSATKPLYWDECLANLETSLTNSGEKRAAK